MNKVLLVLCFVVAINIVSFLMMMVDKSRAAQAGVRRLPERVMFLVAAVGGSLGIYLGMWFFHHKTRKWYFQIGLPLIILQNVVIIYLIYIYSLII